MPFGNKVLFLWCWVPDKPLQRLKLDVVPMWIKFLNLRLYYFNMHVLSGLGILMGKPMFIDRLTTSLSRVAFVRMCVELKAGELSPKSMSFNDEYDYE